MEYKIHEEDNKVVVSNIRDFDLKHIFECGQSFRWYEEKDGGYTGVAKGRVINIKKNADTIFIENSSLEDFNNIWYEYLDLERDYGALKEKLSSDNVLEEAIGFGEGIRILKQDEWEILISFIISANNRIPMIKRAIREISKRWGEEISYNNEKYYTFPKPMSLCTAQIEELEECHTGFRAKYIKSAAEMVYNGEIDLYSLKNLPYKEARQRLLTIPGVGPKVSDCILLFSMQHYEAFPVDVWVKRVMQHFYLAPDVSLKKIEEYGKDKFGNAAGFAQQYLFYYARDMKGKEISV